MTHTSEQANDDEPLVPLKDPELSALLAWLIATLGRSPDGRGGPSHPGFPGTLWYALLWLAAFMAAEPFGFGLAQPWFDPWGWAGRVLVASVLGKEGGKESCSGLSEYRGKSPVSAGKDRPDGHRQTAGDADEIPSWGEEGVERGARARCEG